MNLDLPLQSLGMAGGATALALLYAWPVALAVFLGGPRTRLFGRGAALLVLALPSFFVAGQWMELIGFAGAWRLGGGSWIERWLPALASAHVLGLLLWPIPALLLTGAWDGVDARLWEANPELRGWRIVPHVLWPAARAAVGQAAVLTLMLALGQFAVPALFQAKVWTAEVWVEFSTRFDAGAALGKAAPLTLALVALAFWISRQPWGWPGAGRRPFAGLTEGRAVGGDGFGSLRRVAVGLAVLVVGVSLVLPVGMAVTQARTWTELLPAARSAWPATLRSFGYAAGAASLVLGLGIALARQRWPVVLAVALVLPGVFVGIVWAVLSTRAGAWIDPLRGTGAVVVAALGLRYGFLGWWVAHRAWCAGAPRLREMAELYGAGRWAVWRHVIGPEAGRGLVGAWYVVYLLALWDVESLILVVPPGGDSLSLVIFNLLHYGHNAQVTALCLVLAALAVAPACLGRLARRVTPWAGRAGIGVIGMAVLAGCSAGETRGARVALDSPLFDSVEVIGARGTGPGFFNKPRSVAVDAQDFLYVVDMTGRVQKFDPAGRWQLLWQMPETDKGKAKGMETAPGGGVLVIEPHYHRVNHYSPEGRLLAQWGEHGTNRGQFWFPRAIAASPRGEFFVSEYGVVERVQRFRVADHAFVDSLGSEGNGPGQFNRAEGLGVDREGRVYVADSCNHRVQIFGPDGVFLRAHGQAGQGRGELSYPYDVRVDAEGRQYVCEFGNSRVQIFDAHDAVVETLGGPGTAPGQMNNPWSICLDSRGNLYVADSQNHRVLKFHRRGGAASAEPRGRTPTAARG